MVVGEIMLKFMSVTLHSQVPGQPEGFLQLSCWPLTCFTETLSMLKFWSASFLHNSQYTRCHFHPLSGGQCSNQGEHPPPPAPPSPQPVKGHRGYIPLNILEVVGSGPVVGSVVITLSRGPGTSF